MCQRLSVLMYQNRSAMSIMSNSAIQSMMTSATLSMTSKLFIFLCFFQQRSHSIVHFVCQSVTLRGKLYFLCFYSRQTAEIFSDTYDICPSNLYIVLSNFLLLGCQIYSQIFSILKRLFKRKENSSTSGTAPTIFQINCQKNQGLFFSVFGGCGCLAQGPVIVFPP